MKRTDRTSLPTATADTMVVSRAGSVLVTNVGGLPDLVPDHKVGMVTEPDATSVASGIMELYELGEDFFLPHLREEKKKYSWNKLSEAILHLAG